MRYVLGAINHGTENILVLSTVIRKVRDTCLVLSTMTRKGFSCYQPLHGKYAIRAWYYQPWHGKHFGAINHCTENMRYVLGAINHGILVLSSGAINAARLLARATCQWLWMPHVMTLVRAPVLCLRKDAWGTNEMPDERRREQREYVRRRRERYQKAKCKRFSHKSPPHCKSSTLQKPSSPPLTHDPLILSQNIYPSQILNTSINHHHQSPPSHTYSNTPSPSGTGYSITCINTKAFIMDYIYPLPHTWHSITTINNHSFTKSFIAANFPKTTTNTIEIPLSPSPSTPPIQYTVLFYAFTIL